MKHTHNKHFLLSGHALLNTVRLQWRHMGFALFEESFRMIRNWLKSMRTLAPHPRMPEMRLGMVVLLMILSGSQLSAQSSLNSLNIGTNYRIHPSDVTQTEVFIDISPLDEQLMFVSCNTLTFTPFFVSEGIYYTEDGGSTWQGSDSCSGEPLQFHGGDPGISIDKEGRFIITRLGRAPFVGLYSHYSLDHGRSWSGQKVISTDDLERASVITDLVPSSLYNNRTYAAWVKFATPYPIMISYTDDGAETWSTPHQINAPANRSAGGDLAVGPDGVLYACWAGVTSSSPFKEIMVGFASSHNGGADWTHTEHAFDMNGITGTLENKGNIRVNGLPGMAVDMSGGARNGWIYIVTGQKDLLPAGQDPDVILHRSTDGGQSWSPAIRVNQDALNNGKTQYFPSVHVDHYGAVDIIFYDDRNTSDDSTGVFLARSTDGGDSWKEYEISDHNYKPIPIGGLGQGYQGDNIDMTSTTTKLWPVWMDNSSGNYQIWTVAVNFSSLDGVTEELQNKHSLLDQNFPNPFNKATTIAYRLDKAAFVSLKIYDVFGLEVKELVGSMQSPGEYQLTYTADASVLKGGVYYYCLEAGDYRETKRMIFCK